MTRKNKDLLDPSEIGTTTRPSAAKKSKEVKATGVPVNGFWGVLLLIVAASIMYANYRVFFGTEDLISRIMLAPSTVAVAIFLVYKAAK